MKAIARNFSQNLLVDNRKDLNFSVVRISYPDKLRLSDNGS